MSGTSLALRRLADELGSSLVSSLAACVDAGAMGEPDSRVLMDGSSPWAGMELPVRGASVRDEDGGAGGTMLLLGDIAAKRLARGAMEGPAASSGALDRAELDEGEEQALAEVLDQALQAAAGVASRLLGDPSPAMPVGHHRLATEDEASQVLVDTPYAVVCDVRFAGETLRMLQLVSHARVVRIGTQLELHDLVSPADEASDAPAQPAAVPSGEDRFVDALGDVGVRLQAQVGTALVTIDGLDAMGAGAVLEFVEHGDAPIRLLANGRHLADAALVIEDDGTPSLEVTRLVSGGHAGT